MVFTYEHRVIIKYIRQKFGHGAKKIVKDHPEFDWNVWGVKTLLQKIDETGSIERKEGSGRPKTARTDENIEAVHELVLSQEGKPGTHKTPAEIALELGIHDISVRRIVDNDLELRPLKKKRRNSSVFTILLSWKPLSSAMRRFLKFDSSIMFRTISFLSQRIR